MAVPARRTSKMRKNTRRSHDALVSCTTTNCSNCGAVVLPHHACMKCFTYKGKSIPTSRQTTIFANMKEADKSALKKVDSKNKKADNNEVKK